MVKIKYDFFKFISKDITLIIKTMTTNQNRFNNSKIYTIRCFTDPTLIYVGSTVQVLSKRFHDHKLNCNKDNLKNRLIYKTIRATG